MQTFVKNSALQRRIAYLRTQGKTIGFSPTMGALHEGHLSLMEYSKNLCDYSVCSIFVNPTQFNEASDLEKYPRTLAADKKLLKKIDLDILYAPTVDQIYPKNLSTEVKIDLEGLDKRLEGAFRPGHFEGVVQVVKRLLDIVRPDKLFMGQKDFQQFTIIAHMIRELGLPVELVVVPIKREKDGLAMSSRNVRLTPHFRKQALVLSRMLSYAAQTVENDEFVKIKNTAVDQIEAAGLKVEYFELIDGYTLLPVSSKEDSDYIVAVVAAWAGDVRLIDNAILINDKL
jgi:pantoate--beta-alanine ligase